jgi:hypothetical protein
MDYHYTVVGRLVRKHTQTNNVKDLPRSGRPQVTSDRDHRALQRLVRRMPFATSPVLKQHWLPNRRLSTRTFCVSKPSSGRCRSANRGRLMTPWLKSRWFQTVSNCSCWQTYIGQPVLFEYRTGCEWHPSNQTLQCPVVTIRCYPWSASHRCDHYV